MKIKEKAQNLLVKMKSGLKDYPMPVFLSLITGFLLILLTDRQVYNISLDFANNLGKITRLGLIGMLVFIPIEDLEKKFGYKSFFYSLGGGFLAIYYFIYLSPENYDYIRNIIFLASLVFFYLLSLSYRREDYSRYTIEILKALAIGLGYSLVLLLGLIIILLTIQGLFQIDYSLNLYLYALIISFFYLAFPLYLSNLPGEPREYKYSRVFTSLVNYIIIPLIIIYTIILYVYFGKILLERSWPEGLVSHLVLWYSAFSVLVLIVVDHFQSDIARIFKKIFPKVNIPLLIMMFFSMGIRIREYGITENRYFVLSLGLWVLVSMVYYILNDGERLELLPSFLLVIIFLTIYSPINAFKFSRKSQNKRLEKILVENSMLVDGQVVGRTDLKKTSQAEISNILEYFEEKQDLKDIRVLGDDFHLGRTEEVFGFEYNPDRYLWEDRSEAFEFTLENKLVEVGDYDYVLYGNIWESLEKTYKLGDYSLDLDLGSFKIAFKEDKASLADINLKEEVEEGLKSILSQEEEYGENPIVIERKEGNFRIKLIVLEVNGSLGEDEEMSIEDIDYLDFALLIAID